MIDLIFLGGSTAFYEVFEIVYAINERNPTYNFVGILDDNPELHGTQMRGIPVLGPLKQALSFKEVKFVFGIGSMKTRFVREKIIKEIGLQPEDFVSIIHPLANVDRTAKVGPGCILHAGVCIGNDAILEGFNVIAVNSAIAPYVKIETFAMITSLVVILTGAQIGKMSFIGAHCCVTENIKVGRFVMVGAGSIVTRNVEDGLFVLGNPLRSISKTDISTLS